MSLDLKLQFNKKTRGVYLFNMHSLCKDKVAKLICSFDLDKCRLISNLKPTASQKHKSMRKVRANCYIQVAIQRITIPREIPCGLRDLDHPTRLI